jgi:hypothetical protein
MSMTIEGSRRRRVATYRVPSYRNQCPCRDPWTCHCDDPEPSTRMVDAYRDAVALILDAGMTPAPFVPELRAMWRRGGADRRLARTISERWEVAA